MPLAVAVDTPVEVAPRKGCVSRNLYSLNWSDSTSVAPRKGCVSRNFCLI